jgi:hypothetical protein
MYALAKLGEIRFAIDARSLSDLSLSNFGKAGFGQIFRTFSLNSYGYTPKAIEKSALNRLSLATIA